MQPQWMTPRHDLWSTFQRRPECLETSSLLTAIPNPGHHVHQVARQLSTHAGTCRLVTEISVISPNCYCHLVDWDYGLQLGIHQAAGMF